MQERLDKLYDEITDIENAIEEVETRLYNIRQDKISEDNVYQFRYYPSISQKVSPVKR